MKSPMRPGLPGFETLAGLVGRLALFFGAFVVVFEAALAALLGASGVTVEGALGRPFVAVFFAGPGRFNLALECLKEGWNHAIDVSAAHGHNEIAFTS